MAHLMSDSEFVDIEGDEESAANAGHSQVVQFYQCVHLHSTITFMHVFLYLVQARLMIQQLYFFSFINDAVHA